MTSCKAQTRGFCPVTPMLSGWHLKQMCVVGAPSFRSLLQLVSVSTVTLSLLNRVKNCSRFCCSCPGGDLEGWESIKHSNQASDKGCSQPSTGTCEHRLSLRRTVKNKMLGFVLKAFLVAFKMISRMLWHFHFGAFGSLLTRSCFEVEQTLLLSLTCTVTAEENEVLPLQGGKTSSSPLSFTVFLPLGCRGGPGLSWKCWPKWEKSCGLWCREGMGKGLREGEIMQLLGPPHCAVDQGWWMPVRYSSFWKEVLPWKPWSFCSLRVFYSEIHMLMFWQMPH